MALGGLSQSFGQGAALKVATYPRRRIGRVSQLKADQPVSFQYPWKDVYSTNMLVKLGVPAGGGIGPDQDIVAFSTLCTHMGGPLAGQYRGRYKVLGPCPFHLTTFDLTKHGMVVAGQATESLPQIVLETKGDEIWATGVMGLIYGYHSNLAPGA
jgi:arsenite oxidase small subunit